MNMAAIQLKMMADQNGLKLAFRQEPDGLWVATWRTGSRSVAWCGNLQDMVRVAKGKLVSE